MKGRSSLNPWPAFSDLMFMLALTTLLVAAGVVVTSEEGRQKVEQMAEKLRAKEQKIKELQVDRSEIEKELRELEQQRADVERMQRELGQKHEENERLVGLMREMGLDTEEGGGLDCGLATPVVSAIENCLAKSAVPVQRRGCSISVEGAIEFDFNSTRLSPESGPRAEKIAECVIAGAERVGDLEGTGLDAISIEGHADACGFPDWDRVRTAGMELPAGRAKVVYDLVFKKVVAPDSPYNELDKARLLGRIATRSFGPYRPLADSACDCSQPESCRANRRVEIIVQGQIGSARPNWKASNALVFTPSRGALPAQSSSKDSP